MYGPSTPPHSSSHSQAMNLFSPSQSGPVCFPPHECVPISIPPGGHSCEDAGVLVLMFRCIRSWHVSHNQLDCEWKVRCGKAMQLHIKVHIENSIAHATRIRVTTDTEVLTPSSRLIEDFVHTWHFHGPIKGIGVPGYVQVRVHDGGVERWCPGMIKHHNQNDSFEVLVQKQNASPNAVTDEIRTVHPTDMREASTLRPFERSIHNLVLRIPQHSPLAGASLSIDNGRNAIHYFARPTPSAKHGGHMPKVVVSVAQNRHDCSVNVGHMSLLNHMSNSVRRVSFNGKRGGYFVGYGSKCWVIQIRHAEHTIEVERRSRHTKAIRLVVDGEVLVEAGPEDISCQKRLWECPFRFIGERVLEFDMFDVATNGISKINRSRETQMHPVTHTCLVSVRDFNDMSKTVLTVDGTEFTHLPQQQLAPSNEHNLSPTLAAIESQYGIAVPSKLKRLPPQQLPPSTVMEPQYYNNEAAWQSWSHGRSHSDSSQAGFNNQFGYYNQCGLNGQSIFGNVGGYSQPSYNNQLDYNCRQKSDVLSTRESSVISPAGYMHSGPPPYQNSHHYCKPSPFEEIVQLCAEPSCCTDIPDYRESEVLSRSGEVMPLEGRPGRPWRPGSAYSVPYEHQNIVDPIMMRVNTRN